MNLLLINIMLAAGFMIALETYAFGTLAAGLIIGYGALWLTRPLYGDRRYFNRVPALFRLGLFFIKALVFLYMTAPVAAHLIGRAAYRSGIRLYHRTWVDHLKQDMPETPDPMKADPETEEFQSYRKKNPSGKENTRSYR